MAKQANGYISASDFLAAITVQPVDLDVAGVGHVQVRGLTLMEMQSLAESISTDPRQAAVEAISIGMVNPQLNAGQVRQMGNFKAGAIDVINVISNRIFELSAMSAAEELEKKVGNGS